MINIKLGIIYYFDDIILHNRLDYIDYIKVSSAEDILLINKPTLIIGWDLVKTKYNNITILNKKITNLYSWTFSFNEKKGDYINDILKFTTKDILKIFDFYEYKILSPVFDIELNDISDYIKYFEDCELNNIYVSKLKQLSILCNDTIYRINLRELKYYKIDYIALINYLKDKYKNFTYDGSGKIEGLYINYFKNLDENIIKRYIPLFNKVLINN